MKLTYRDKLVLHMALMEYLERRIGDPAQPDEQMPESVLAYVNRRYSNHDVNFKEIMCGGVYLNCVRAKALLRDLSDEPDELEQPTKEQPT